jgi:hypothetical protein
MRSRRTATIGLVAALLVGIVALVVGALTSDSDVAQTVGVLPVYPVAPLAAGEEACESPVALADPVERVRFHIGTFGKPGPPLAFTVRNAGGAFTLGHGDFPGGWVDDGSPKDVTVGRIAGDQSVSVCVRNKGATPAFVYGDIYTGTFGTGPLGVRPTITTAAGSVDGKEIPGDLAVEFTTPQPRSLLARLPGAFRPAALFRPAGVGAWTYWLLAALILVAAPFLLLRALVRAGDEDPDPPLPSTTSR